MTLPYINYKATAIFLLCFVVFLWVSYKDVSASTLYLNPATGSIEQENFEVNITLDSVNDTNIESAEIFITYNPSQIEALTITNGEFDNYSVKEIDNAVGLITIKAEMVTPPSIDTILNVGKIRFLVVKGDLTTNIGFSKSTTNKTKVLSTSGTDTLENTSDASLSILPLNTTTTTISSQTNITVTGSYDKTLYIGIFLSLVIFGLLTRKYAFSKF